MALLLKPYFSIVEKWPVTRLSWVSPRPVGPHTIRARSDFPGWRHGTALWLVGTAHARPLLLRVRTRKRSCSHYSSPLFQNFTEIDSEPRTTCPEPFTSFQLMRMISRNIPSTWATRRAVEVRVISDPASGNVSITGPASTSAITGSDQSP